MKGNAKEFRLEIPGPNEVSLKFDRQTHGIYRRPEKNTGAHNQSRVSPSSKEKVDMDD